jgi:hypothetical protein
MVENLVSNAAWCQGKIYHFSMLGIGKRGLISRQAGTILECVKFSRKKKDDNLSADNIILSADSTVISADNTMPSADNMVLSTDNTMTSADTTAISADIIVLSPEIMVSSANNI